jgi:hypothetical protein
MVSAIFHDFQLFYFLTRMIHDLSNVKSCVRGAMHEPG